MQQKGCPAAAQTVKDARSEEGFSQEELAELAGLSQPFISSIEKAEERISWGTADKLSSFLPNTNRLELLRLQAHLILLSMELDFSKKEERRRLTAVVSPLIVEAFAGNTREGLHVIGFLLYAHLGVNIANTFFDLFKDFDDKIREEQVS